MSSFIDIDESQKNAYNASVTHPLQSFEWGEFRKKTGLNVIRRGIISNDKVANGFTLTLHPIPKTTLNIGYLPKGDYPSPQLITELQRIGKENNCIFIQLEPQIPINVYSTETQSIINSYNHPLLTELSPSLTPSAHPLFTKFTFQLDLTTSDADLFSAMHHKTRYNIKISKKHNVQVVEDNTDDAFERYLDLMLETTRRQGFYAHTPVYHKNMWETLKASDQQPTTNDLNAHLLLAKYIDDEKIEHILTSWVLFSFHDTLYYPYGASSGLFRNTMHSTAMMWQAIQYGKKHKLKVFDMWGSLGPNADTKDPWYGFHRFKEGFSPDLVEFIGSYDLVINPIMYEVYKVADKLRWKYLKLRR